MKIFLQWSECFEPCNASRTNLSNVGLFVLNNFLIFLGMGVNYDCVIINGLSTSKGKALTFEAFCGLGGLAEAGGAVAAAANQKTLCSKFL